MTYFHMECRYLDSDGAVFGEVPTALDIAIFSGVKRIVALDAFPLAHHPHRTEMRAGLVARGRRFFCRRTVGTSQTAVVRGMRSFH